MDHLIQAFGKLSGESRLRIWGRDRGVETQGLKALARSLPGTAGERVEWMGEYRNQDIVPDVFNLCDAVVVPSIWAENSPLVIHEAQQARVPVITADYGGMAEYVHHEENGLLFTHRDPESLARQMQRLADDPELASGWAVAGTCNPPTATCPTCGTTPLPWSRSTRDWSGKGGGDDDAQPMRCQCPDPRQAPSRGRGASPSTPTRTTATCTASCARTTRRTAQRNPTGSAPGFPSAAWISIWYVVS